MPHIGFGSPCLLPCSCAGQEFRLLPSWRHRQCRPGGWHRWHRQRNGRDTSGECGIRPRRRFPGIGATPRQPPKLRPAGFALHQNRFPRRLSPPTGLPVCRLKYRGKAHPGRGQCGAVSSLRVLGSCVPIYNAVRCTGTRFGCIIRSASHGPAQYRFARRAIRCHPKAPPPARQRALP